ncbi:hypothetical protein [Aquabacterium sp. OR-4]|uniref:hypothetical protein n=1 Tax=Aquabacterium sp. OR-4 TaxID=2978127 RepID=UPI0021B4B8E9|nr:hypothetical protein [Aquabacterium sp. OR-4]MDT7836327.1 hypothetical protein [Aquabacterium sp. OR-4]
MSAQGNPVSAPGPAQGEHPTAPPAGAPLRPRQVLLFTGHVVDRPGRTPPRFPETAVPAAAARIAALLAELQAGADDLALTQGAAGGDLLFIAAAQARGMPVQLLQPFDEPQFLAESVLPHGEPWLARYAAMRAQLGSGQPILAAPAVLGPLPAGGDAYERCNLWLLERGLAHGAERLQLIALWNGAGGDGPGGTAHMVHTVRERGGRVSVIDTRSLG